MKRLWGYIFVILCLWMVYLWLSIITPSPESTQKYDITPNELLVLKISVALPFLACWIFAISGWVYFREYTRGLPKGIKKRAYNNISIGFLVLIVNLVGPTLINTAYHYFNGPDSGEISIKINNYIGVFLPLIGFLWMFIGASQLMKSTGLKIASWSKAITVFLPVTLFGIFYVAMIFTNPSRQFSADPAIPASYYASDLTIVLTIIFPVIATWVIGLMLALNLEQFSHQASFEQKSALVNIYNGVLLIVGSGILAQTLESVGAERFSSYGIGIILGLVYLLLAIIAIGFAFVARGAKKLARLKIHKTAV